MNFHSQCVRDLVARARLCEIVHMYFSSLYTFAAFFFSFAFVHKIQKPNEKLSDIYLIKTLGLSSFSSASIHSARRHLIQQVRRDIGFDVCTSDFIRRNFLFFFRWQWNIHCRVSRLCEVNKFVHIPWHHAITKLGIKFLKTYRKFSRMKISNIKQTNGPNVSANLSAHIHMNIAHLHSQIASLDLSRKKRWAVK